MVAKRFSSGKNKKKNTVLQSIIVSGIFAGLLIFIIGFFAYQNIKMAQKRSDLEMQLAELRARAQELASQKEELEENAAAAQTPEYQEKVLREQGFQKEGEEVVIVLPPEVEAEVAPVREEETRTWLAPLEFLRSLFR